MGVSKANEIASSPASPSGEKRKRTKGKTTQIVSQKRPRMAPALGRLAGTRKIIYAGVAARTTGSRQSPAAQKISRKVRKVLNISLCSLCSLWLYLYKERGKRPTGASFGRRAAAQIGSPAIGGGQYVREPAGLAGFPRSKDFEGCRFFLDGKAVKLAPEGGRHPRSFSAASI